MVCVLSLSLSIIIFYIGLQIDCLYYALCSSAVPRSSSPGERSAPHAHTDHASHSPSPSGSYQAAHGHLNGDNGPVTSITARTELSFDFHRLNVLLLRAVLKDNVHCGRKIATATMSEAKIHATIGLLFTWEENSLSKC